MADTADVKEPKKLRPALGEKPYWEKRIRREFLTVTGAIPQQKLKRFFSGHSMRLDFLPHREKYASWAIGEALREFSLESSQITGNVMETESVTLEPGTKNVPTEILDAIRADGQRDVDAEDLNGTKGTKGERVQNIGSAAQSLISASPNSLGPPITACATYLKMTKCGTYGRNNLAVWKSPLFPTLNNVDGAKGFLDNQITAIVWILSRFFGELPKLKVIYTDTDEELQTPETPAEKANRERLRAPKLFGGILADSMGLGKTLTTVAAMEILAGQGLNVQYDKDGKPKYYPMAVFAPNATVGMQWVDEIDHTIDRSAVSTIVVSGNGFAATDRHKRVIEVPRDGFGLKTDDWPEALQYMWDENDPRAARTVMVMSMDTWSSRTCEVVRDEAEKTEAWTSTFTELGRKFSLVVVDEAYKVKNSATRNWKSVALLERQFTLLITATPCMNTLTDLLGLARLLWTTPSAYLEQEKPDTWELIQETVTHLHDLKLLENFEAWDDFQLVAARPSLLSKILNIDSRRARTHDIQLARGFLKYFESLAILRRSPSSYIYADWEKKQPVSLEGLLPTADNYTVDIQPDHTLAEQCQRAHIELFIDYMEAINKWDSSGKSKRKINREDCESVVVTYRRMQIAAASLDVYRLEKLFTVNEFGTKSEHVTIMRNAGITFVRLAQFLLEPHDPNPKVALDYVKLAVRKSPILRYILQHIKETILTRKPGNKVEKLLITEATPILALYYELVIQFLGIKCRTLHSDLSHEARRDLIADFNDDSRESCQILIQMYTVGFAGSNLHKNCARVLNASQAVSLAVQWQANHRVIRVGQTSDVKVYRLKVNNSYHAFRESRQIEKLLPELGSRAQGQTNKALVRLLDLFQFEVDQAWKSPEGQRLLAEKNLLSDRRAQEENPKRMKLENGAAPPRSTPEVSNESSDATDTEDSDDTENTDGVDGTEMADETEDNDDTEDSGDTEDSEDTDEDEQEPTPPPEQPLNGSSPKPEFRKRKRELEEGHAGWINHDPEELTDTEAFLAMRTRDAYYNEFKSLPRKAKMYFSHEKNNLRRILSYGNPNGNKTTRVWTIQDLDDSAVLERAMELMLRVRLGAKNIEMLPLPQIDFSLAPRHLRAKLPKLLADVTHTAQDFDAASAKPNAKPDRNVQEMLKAADSKGVLNETDRVFEDEAVYGSQVAIAKAEERQEREIKGEEPEEDDGKIRRDPCHFGKAPSPEVKEERGGEFDDDEECKVLIKCEGSKKGGIKEDPSTVRVKKEDSNLNVISLLDSDDDDIEIGAAKKSPAASASSSSSSSSSSDKKGKRKAAVKVEDNSDDDLIFMGSRPKNDGHRDAPISIDSGYGADCEMVATSRIARKIKK